MGEIFLYTYFLYSSYPFRIADINKTDPPAPLLPPISYIHCHPIYSLPVFSRLPIPSFSFPSPSFRLSSWSSLRWLSFFPLFVSSGRCGWAFRSVPSLALFFVSFLFLVSFSCRVVGRCAVFVSSFSRVVLSCHERSFPRGGVVLRFGLSSRWGVPFGGSFVPSSRPSARPSARCAFRVCLRLVRSSRIVVSQGVSFHPIVLVASSVSPCPGPCLIERGVNVSFLSWVSGGSSC